MLVHFNMQRIAVDIDEVLVPFVRPMAAWHRREMPTARKYKYVYRDMFNVTEEESQRMVHDFYKTPEFLYLRPIMGSQRAMLRMRRGATKMYIVTGRQDAAREQTELWIDRHFPGIFDDIILTNSYTPMEVKKVDICRSLALDTIIDDSIDTCLECMQAGMDAIHFVGDEVYPWCEESDISVRGWKSSLGP
jgi:5'(3')-deoxyribonucleotidase